MFRYPLIIKGLVCLGLLTSCGYHSVNQPPIGSCELIAKVNIENRILRPGFETTIQRLVNRYFQTSVDHNHGLELSVRLRPVTTRLTGFTRRGQLGAKVFEVQSQLDVMTHEQQLWSVQSRATSPIIAHRTDPMWSAAAEDVGLREVLEKSIAELHMRFEAKCRRKLVKKEAL
jgi:hypothetical protein